jgi:hypothetical protein
VFSLRYGLESCYLGEYLSLVYSPQFYHVHLRTLFFLFNLALPGGRTGTEWERSYPKKIIFFPVSAVSPATTPLTFPYLLFGCKRMRTTACADADTYGSGVWYGEDVCLTYCVLWNTRNARLAKKSRAVSRPAAGRRVNPVCSETEQRSTFKIQS